MGRKGGLVFTPASITVQTRIDRKGSIQADYDNKRPTVNPQNALRIEL